jgi:hypothetical protein
MAYTLQIENGDITRYTTGSGYYLVSGSTKLKQDVKCILSTDIRPFSGLGCSLDASIGEDVMNRIDAYAYYPAVFNFRMRVQEGLLRLQRAQRLYQFSKRTTDELIDTIRPVQIYPSGNDPRNYNWRVDILSIDKAANFTINGRAVV